MAERQGGDVTEAGISQEVTKLTQSKLYCHLSIYSTDDKATSEVCHTSSCCTVAPPPFSFTAGRSNGDLELTVNFISFKSQVF